MVNLVLEDKVFNIISIYTPQVGCEGSQQDGFWQEMNKVMQGIPINEDIVIGGNLNGHVENNRFNYDIPRVHVTLCGTWT